MTHPEDPAGAAPEPDRLAQGLALGLPPFALLVFLPAFRIGFAQDDFSRLERALSGFVWQLDQWLHYPRGLHRPVLGAYFDLVVRVFGVRVGAFHALAFVLHCLNAYLLAGLARRMGADRRSALLAAYFHAAHPALFTALAWPSAATSILMLTALLLALRLHLARRGAWRIWLALVPLALALLTREIAVLALPLLALLAWARPRTAGASRAAWLATLLPAAGLVALYLVWSAQGRAHMARPESPYALGIGAHVFSNAAFLSSASSGWIVAARPLRHAVLGGLVWLVASASAWGALRRGERLPAAGLLAWALGMAPMTLLVHQRGFAYYLDLALPGLALCLAGSLTGRRWLRHVLGPIACVAAWSVIVVPSVREQYRSSPVREMAERAERVRRSLTEHLPVLPAGTARIRIESADVSDLQWATGFGALFRVHYRAPRLRVEYVEPGVEPPADGPVLVLREADFELRPR